MLTTFTLLALSAAPDCEQLFRAVHPDFTETKTSDDHVRKIKREFVRGPSHVPLDGLTCAEWPARPELTVLAANTFVNESCFIDVIVLRGDAQVSSARLDQEYCDSSKLSVDTAAYRAPDGSPAFGIRVDRDFVANYEGHDTTTLSLFTVERDQLHVALDGLEMKRESWINGDDERCEEQRSTLTRTVWNDEQHRLFIRSVRTERRGCGEKTTQPPVLRRLLSKNNTFVLRDLDTPPTCVELLSAAHPEAKFVSDPPDASRLVMLSGSTPVDVECEPLASNPEFVALLAPIGRADLPRYGVKAIEISVSHLLDNRRVARLVEQEPGLGADNRTTYSIDTAPWTAPDGSPAFAVFRTHAANNFIKTMRLYAWKGSTLRRVLADFEVSQYWMPAQDERHQLRAGDRVFRVKNGAFVAPEELNP